MSFVNRCVVLLALSALTAPIAGSAAAIAYQFKGTWIEGCSCSVSCGCDLTGLAKGCETMGAILFSSGMYQNTDLTGARVGWGTIPGKWVRLYIQAKTPAQRKAAEAMARVIMADFGKVESARSAKVGISGSNGSFTLTVDGGAVLKLVTKPVLGVDKKTAVTMTNYPDPYNHTMMQAMTVAGAYHDGTRHISLKGSNSFFDTQMSGSKP